MTGRVTISEVDGIRYLHLGTEWIQGAMRIADPLHLELEYIQQMMVWWLFEDEPKHIVQLGLGAGSLTRFAYHYFPDAQVTAVELNPDVVRAGHALFALPQPDARLALRIECAARWAAAQPAHSVDSLQLDLYHANSYAPALQSPEFYQDCARVLTDQGMLTVNLLGTPAVHRINLERLEAVFPAVVWLPESHDGNVVALAFKDPPSIDFSELELRAQQIQLVSSLPAQSWVQGLLRWMEHYT